MNRQLFRTAAFQAVRRHPKQIPPGLKPSRRFLYQTAMLDSASRRPLTYADGPLVWIDCEMTGLDYKKDRIIEIAVLITDGDLNVVDENGLDYVIQTDDKVLKNMNDWCVKQHGKSGLTQACLDSPHTYQSVYDSVLSYVRQWIPEPRIGVLAGNSVHMDRIFLAEGMPKLVDHLDYRIVDVSTIKELNRRWYPKSAEKFVYKDSTHRALGDIKNSIAELKWYRENVFKSPSSPGTEMFNTAQ